MHVAATLVRGGTSKCWLFDGASVPTSADRLEELLVRAYGAGDPVQLDGVGGATPTTSKAAVVGRSEVPGVDVEYLFGQVGIGVERVEWGSNCGNCATAIALWSVARGLVAVRGDRTRVVMRNVNTGAVLEAEVDTTGGVVHEFGTQTVPGTRAGGVAVGLSFLDPGGATTGSLLPTGQAVEELDVDGVPVRVSMVDAGAPVVLVDAARIGRTATEPAAELAGLVPWLRAVRHTAARKMGLARPGGTADDAVPKVGIVGAPGRFTSATGEDVDAADYDVAVRMLSMNAPHPAIGLTSAVAVAAASGCEGSVVHSATRQMRAGAVVRIGTPSGVVAVTSSGTTPAGPARVTVARAARILCDADLLVPDPAPVSA